MAKPRAVVEAQLAKAKKNLELVVAKLKAEKIDQSEFKYQPLWRQYNAKVKQFNLQLKAVERIENLSNPKT